MTQTGSQTCSRLKASPAASVVDRFYLASEKVLWTDGGGQGLHPLAGGVPGHPPSVHSTLSHVLAQCLAVAFRIESRLVIRDVPRGGELVKFGKAVGAALSLSHRLGRAVALKLRSCHHYPEHFDRSLSDSNHGRGHGNGISRPWYAPTPLHVRYVPKASKALFVPFRPPPGVVNRNYGSNTSNSRQLQRHAVPGRWDP